MKGNIIGLDKVNDLNFLKGEKMTHYTTRQSNQEIYRQKLIEEFKVAPPSNELFLPIESCFRTLDDDTEKMLLDQRALFYGKKWTEVNFDDQDNFTYPRCWWPDLGVSIFTKQGRIYYLPAFLSYFYEIDNFTDGNVYDFFQDLFFRLLDEGEDVHEVFTPEQAKLITLFLINLATLGEKGVIQSLVTSEWGHFLLF